MLDPVSVLDHIVRTDFATFGQWSFGVLNPNRKFVLNPYYVALCHALDQLMTGEIKRLLITLPPRSGKSELASVAFSAYMLGHYPELRILCASYSADLAEAFQIQSRRIMEEERYRRLFPRTRFSRQQATKDRFLTTRNGGRLATSVGGKATGFGGDLIILDDIMRAADARSEAEHTRVWEWFVSTLPSRFDNPATGRMIVVAQRLHIDDLPGRLIAQGGWTHLDLPALAWRDQKIPIGEGRTWYRKVGDLLMPERLGHDELVRLKREMGSADFEAQYNQRPAAPEGRLIKLEWFGTFEQQKQLYRRDFEAILQSWDTALTTDDKADYSACVTIGLRGKQIYVLDVYRDRLMFTEQMKAILAHKEKYKADLVSIEKTGSGHLLWEELHVKQRMQWLIHYNVNDAKTERAEQQTAKLEAGQVLLPDRAQWLEMFKKELAEFPRGRHDDLVDAFTQALRMLDYRRPELEKCSYYQHSS